MGLILGGFQGVGQQYRYTQVTAQLHEIDVL